MAEAIFRHKIEALGLSEKVQINSAGTAGYHIGDQPDHRTIEVLRNHGIETDHRAEQVMIDDGQQYDFIVAMDRANQSDLRGTLPDQEILLMRDYDTTNGGAEVPDPYYGNLSNFEDVYQILERSLDEFIKKVILPSLNLA